jgi:hypothetical protein
LIERVKTVWVVVQAFVMMPVIIDAVARMPKLQWGCFGGGNEEQG